MNYKGPRERENRDCSQRRAPFLLELNDSQFLNLGYWNRKGISIAQAQLKLVDIFGEFSELVEGVEVVDVGCGTGEQDLYFLDHFNCKRIIGINISEVQIRLALEK